MNIPSRDKKKYQMQNRTYSLGHPLTYTNNIERELEKERANRDAENENRDNDTDIERERSVNRKSTRRRHTDTDKCEHVQDKLHRNTLNKCRHASQDILDVCRPNLTLLRSSYRRTCLLSSFTVPESTISRLQRVQD